MSKIIGIDLGTTNSCISILESGESIVLENMEGGRTTPSMVAYAADGERRVGQTAKRQMVVNPENTLFAIKRLMGRRYNDPIIQREKKMVAYKIVELENGDACVEVWGQKMAPAEVSAIILQKMKKIAEENLGEVVKNAVITVPAYFTEAQRQATRDAGRIAGLNVMRIINEPTAAALAYGLEKDEGKTIAVFDLGGGTFDISILEIGEGVFQVKATNGDTFLGGEDFDQCVINYLAEEFIKLHHVDPRLDKEALQRIKEAAEIARIELSTSLRSEINLPFLCFDHNGPKNFKTTLTRAKLEELVEALIARTITPCEIAIKDAGLSLEEIDEVILAGGMTRMPKIREVVANFFGIEPRLGVNPDEIVAMGAAIQGGVLGGEIRDVLLLDVTPLSLGIETKGGIFNVLIPKNETIPCLYSKTFSTVMDNQKFATVRVAQGERGMFGANHFLGEFTLDGLPPAPRGTPRIEVTFVVDADGMVKAAAIDKATGKEQSISVKVSGGLEESAIETMIQEAEKHAEEDARQQRLIQVINQADGTLHRIKHYIATNKATLDKSVLEQFHADEKKLQRAVTIGKDLNEISELSTILVAMMKAPIGQTETIAAPVAQEPAAANTETLTPDAVDAEEVMTAEEIHTQTADVEAEADIKIHTYADVIDVQEEEDAEDDACFAQFQDETDPEETMDFDTMLDEEEITTDEEDAIMFAAMSATESAADMLTTQETAEEMDLEMDLASATEAQDAEDLRLLAEFVANPLESLTEDETLTESEVVNMTEMATAILQNHHTVAEIEEEECLALAS